MNYISVGIGGMAGSVLRYLISLYTASLWAAHFPLGTFIANITGCFILGCLTGMNHKKERIPKQVMLGLGTGMIGSLTTFSAVSVETMKLYEQGSILLAFIYVFLSAGLGLGTAWMGFQYGAKRNEKKVKQ